MSLFDQVSVLQREWTDQFVQVDDSVAELKRFAGLTGQVKTVNMSGQALVEFCGTEDISWYDIHPQFLTVVEVEEEAEVQAETAEAAPPAKAAPPAEAPVAAPAADTSKLSPLERARMQDTGGDAPAAAAPAETPAAEADVAEQPPAKAPAAAPAADTSKLSPLEQARMQDTGGDAPAAAAPAAAEADVAEETPADEAEVAEQAPAAEEEAAEETAAEDSSTPSVEIPDAEGPERTAAVLAACRAQDGG
jgi:hypothetical protein